MRGQKRNLVMDLFLTQNKSKTKDYNDDDGEEKEEDKTNGKVCMDLGEESQVIYIQKFISFHDSWNYFHYLNNHIPWTRPTIRVFGRSLLQPRDTCYVASAGITELVYNGYKPHAYSWDDFPPLKEILEAVGNDYVGWHADDEKLYGPTPEIASISFGCERDFLLKKRPDKTSKARETEDEASPKQRKKNADNQHSFTLKHGSLLVMRGYTQRDWLHSVPKRAKADNVRINLTFRRVF